MSKKRREWWKPGDLVAVAVFTIASGRPREIAYRKTYRWRWIAEFWARMHRWDYAPGVLLFWRACGVGEEPIYG